MTSLIAIACYVAGIATAFVFAALHAAEFTTDEAEEAWREEQRKLKEIGLR